MKTAIEILEKQVEWVKNNRELCPHGDKYYEGYKESAIHCLALLESAKQQIGEI